MCCFCRACAWLLARSRHRHPNASEAANSSGTLGLRRASTHSSGRSSVGPTRRSHAEPMLANAREKELKKWRRDWEIRLIEEQNPGWRDLYHDGRLTAQQSFRGVAIPGTAPEGPTARGREPENPRTPAWAGAQGHSEFIDCARRGARQV